MNKRFIIATGGTGGHIFPALSLAKALKSKGFECLIIADKRFLNFKSKIPGSLKYCIIPSGSVSGNVFKKIFLASKIVLGIALSLMHILLYRPKMIISFGGYPSFPTMASAILLRKPLMIHEQNSVIGRANKIFIRWANIISVPFDSVKGLDGIDQTKINVVGNPVDESIAKIGEEPYAEIKKRSKINLLVLGGSQGARILSSIVPEAIKYLDKSISSRLKIVQQCRAEDIVAVKNIYENLSVEHEVSSFFVDMESRLKSTHLAICRSGASTVSELIASGRPSILVPIAISNDNHQLLNARELESSEAGWIIEEKDFDTKNLTNKLTYLLSNPSSLSKASIKARSLFIDSNKNMIELIERFCAHK